MSSPSFFSGIERASDREARVNHLPRGNHLVGSDFVLTFIQGKFQMYTVFPELISAFLSIYSYLAFFLSP